MHDAENSFDAVPAGAFIASTVTAVCCASVLDGAQKLTSSVDSSFGLRACGHSLQLL